MASAFLFCTDWRVMGLVDCDAIVTDPPYGIGYKVNLRRGHNRGIGLDAAGEVTTPATAPIAGDLEPFDPSPFLRKDGRKAAFFGAQHFSDKLPRGRWLVWDKRRESKPDNHSDGDLVWMTGDSREALRIHRQKWRGIIREGEENCSRSRKLHPNQKPVALIENIFGHLGMEAGQSVFDPYMGSGSTGVAALRRGLTFIGMEIDPGHFSTAVTRLTQEFGLERVSVLMDARQSAAA